MARTFLLRSLIAATALVGAAGCGNLDELIAIGLADRDKASPRPVPSASASTGSPEPSAAPTASPLPAPPINAEPSASPSSALEATPGPTPTATPGQTTPRVMGGPMREFKPDHPGQPTGVAADSQGAAWVAYGSHHLKPEELGLIKLSPQGAELLRLPLAGRAENMVVDRADHLWVVLDQGGGTDVSRIAPDGTVLGTVRIGNLNNPIDLRLDAQGNAWVSSHDRLVKVSPQLGMLASVPGTGEFSAALDAAGHLWTLAGRDRLVEHDAAGRKVRDYPAPAGNTYNRLVGGDSRGRIWLYQRGDSSNSGRFAILNGGTLEHEFAFGMEANHHGLAGADGSMWIFGVSGAKESGSVLHLGADGTPLASYLVGDYLNCFGLGGDGAVWAVRREADAVVRWGP